MAVKLSKDGVAAICKKVLSIEQFVVKNYSTSSLWIAVLYVTTSSTKNVAEFAKLLLKRLELVTGIPLEKGRFLCSLQSRLIKVTFFTSDELSIQALIKYATHYLRACDKLKIYQHPDRGFTIECVSLHLKADVLQTVKHELLQAFNSLPITQIFIFRDCLLLSCFTCSCQASQKNLIPIEDFLN
jgi:hypothetical protein